MRTFGRGTMYLLVPMAAAIALSDCSNDSVSPAFTRSKLRKDVGVTYPLVTFTGAVGSLAVGDSELVHAYIQMAADSATRPCGNCYFASTSESIVHVAATTGWGTGTIGHIHGAAAGTASFYSDTVGNNTAAGTYQVIVRPYPIVTYTGASDTLAVGDSELVHAYIKMAADSASRPCGNCYFASTNENIVHVASTTGWGTGTVGHITAPEAGSATLYSDTVGNNNAAGSDSTTVVSANHYTPNEPSGMTTVLSTGRMMTAPSQTSGGQWTQGTATFTNFSPNTKSSVGEWAQNIQAAPGSGVRLVYDSTLSGGNSPVRWGSSISGTGTGYLYIAMLFQLSPAWSFSQASGIKVGEPRTTGTNENHVIAITDPDYPSNGANGWIYFFTQFTAGTSGIDADYPSAPDGSEGPTSDFLSAAANIAGTARGSWHLLEWYLQPESVAGNNDGNVTMWVDGIEAFTTVGLSNGQGGRPPHGVTFFEAGETMGWNYFMVDPTFGGDQATDHPPGSEYTQYDRIFVAVK